MQSPCAKAGVTMWASFKRATAWGCIAHEPYVWDELDYGELIQTCVPIAEQGCSSRAWRVGI